MSLLLGHLQSAALLIAKDIQGDGQAGQALSPRDFSLQAFVILIMLGGRFPNISFVFVFAAAGRRRRSSRLPQMYSSLLAYHESCSNADNY